jgi:hypothetical protein
LLILTLGVGLGYVAFKSFAPKPEIAASDVRTMLSASGKPLTLRQALQGSYLLGYSDGKGGQPASSDVMSAMQAMS